MCKREFSAIRICTLFKCACNGGSHTVLFAAMYCTSTWLTFMHVICILYTSKGKRGTRVKAVCAAHTECLSLIWRAKEQKWNKYLCICQPSLKLAFSFYFIRQQHQPYYSRINTDIKVTYFALALRFAHDSTCQPFTKHIHVTLRYSKLWLWQHV